MDNLLSFIHGIDFIPKMKRQIPSIYKILMVQNTFGSHVLMSMDTQSKGEIQRTMILVLSFPNVRKVVLVDRDVDPEDEQEVEWSPATRFQADRDLILIPGLRGQPIDPSSGEGFLTTKIGMDATRPKKEGFDRVNIPEEVKVRLTPVLKNLKKEGVR